MSAEAIAVWVFEKLWLVVSAGLLWVFKQHSKKQEFLENKIESLEKEMISHTEAKELVHSIVGPLSKQQEEMKVDIKNVLSTVQGIEKALAVQEAIYKIQHQREKE